MDRISTSLIASRAVDIILERQAQLSDLQQTVATGRRVLRPSDDPVAAAQAEQTRSDIARMQVETRMIDFARQKLQQAEGALADGNDIMQRARELLIAANNDTYGASDRANFAQELRGLRNELLGLANRGDGLGSYLFGGIGSRTAPFEQTADGITFVADAGTRETGQAYRLATSIDGRELFGSADPGGGSNSVFTMLDETIAALQNAAIDPQALHIDVAAGIDGVDAAIDRFNNGRALLGQHLGAADRAEQDIARGTLGANERLSSLVDADLAEAISALAQGQTELDAAMQTYVKISGQSLFDYIR